MTEKPILFSGPMVRQVLAGLKTQTRRPVKPQPEHGAGPCHWSPTGWAARSGDGSCTCQPIRCPYGEPGDRLWVRETWAKGWTWMGAQKCVFYRADGAGMTGSEKRPVCPGDEPAASVPDGIKWRPSVHMPRWASRLTLDVLSVRVERVQDISREDAEAEGFSFDSMRGTPLTVVDPNGSESTGEFAWAAPEYAFSCAWEAMYPGSWQRSGWVWVIEFRRAEVTR